MTAEGVRTTAEGVRTTAEGIIPEYSPNVIPANAGIWKRS